MLSSLEALSARPALLAFPPEGELINSPSNRDYLSSETMLRRAFEGGVILEGMATLCDPSLELTVDLGCMKGYIPRGEAAFVTGGAEVRDIAVITRVGRPVCFMITGFCERNGARSALLSRRAAQLECARNFLASLAPGDIVDARVTHLEQFGAFCDIGCGLVSLLPVDCISVSRISHPRDRLRPGMRLRAAIRSIDRETGRVCLTLRELLGTWQENAALFEAGQTVAGVVRGVEEYGIFVELTPNLAGLAEFKPDITAGQSASVYIKSILPERMKIKLALIDACGTASPLSKLRYYPEDGGSHIDYWRYSPRGCPKLIETNFMENAELG